MGAVHEPPEGSAAEGREIVYWLAMTCRELRERAGVHEETIAHYSGQRTYTIERFERFERFPKHLDPIIAAYAKVAGFADDRELYLDAIDLWIEQGEPHAPPEIGRADERIPAEVATARQRQEARARRQARRARGAKPTPNTTRRRVAG